jgi:DNA-binding Lrp family transcriptional regulator
MEKRKKCYAIRCSECGKKLGFLKGYHHPVKGHDKCVCGICWNKIEKSEEKYSNFIYNSVNKKNRGFICYIMINTKPKFEHRVCESLAKTPEIIEFFPLLGKHDIIAKLKVDDYEKLGSFIINKIRRIEGISETKTLTGAFSLSG